MNAVHIHLALNHVPVLGTFFVLFFLGYGMVRRSDEVMRLALWVLVVCALGAVVVNFSGEGAVEAVQGLPGITSHEIRAHHKAAQWAYAGSLALGVVALGGHVAFRGGRKLPRWFLWSITVGALLVAAMMARTANLGGKIRHAEIEQYPSE